MATTQSWGYLEDLITDRTNCEDCRGDLVASSDPPSEVTIYTRNGTKFAQHYHKECPNRWCRKSFYYGYSMKNGIKVYDTDSLKCRKYLVTSDQTALAVDFCYEVTLHILHNNATFHGLENVYNQFHNFNRFNIKRVDVNRKRLATAFFLYGFLEFTSRSGTLHKFKSGDNWLDDTILEHYNLSKAQFSHHWTDEHFCTVANCETMMVSDGGMKIHRSVCAAKFSGVRKYSNSKKTVLTGCTASPSPNSPFCSEHSNSESPVLLAEKLSKDTRSYLHDWRVQSQKTHISLPKDTVFIVQAVLESRKVKKTTEFLVKFAGFPKEASCWEPSKNLPEFILNFYKNEKNLGKAIPGPKIKQTKHVENGTEMFVNLEWTNDASKEAFDGEDLFDLDADRLCEEAMKSTCNTRKVRDKRDRRHTAGILISAKPCGIIPHVDELFGCESITQVHGSIIEFLGTVSRETREKLKLWMFDDMCHLKPHSEKQENREQSDVTELYADLSKAVDKFHFPGHKKSDSYCRENCNPNTELKKLDIKEINSPACEQAFKWINAFKNLKTMNEARFKFFLLYMIDLHNLHIEDKVSEIANPLNANRGTVSQDDITLVKEMMKMNIATKSINLDEETNVGKEKVEAVSKTTKIEDCFFEDDSGNLCCNFCPGKYKREGHLKNHVESKHNIKVDLICKCGQVFIETTRYCRHRKSCK